MVPRGGAATLRATCTADPKLSEPEDEKVAGNTVKGIVVDGVTPWSADTKLHCDVTFLPLACVMTSPT